MPWQGGVVPGRWAGVNDERIWCVLAPNPGPMMLEGTNTWILHLPGAAEAVVLDPGPDDEAHLNAVLAAVHDRGAQVAVALLTHGHEDHHAGARRFTELAGCSLRAKDPGLCFAGPDPSEGLELDEGEVVTVEGLSLTVLATPGHTSDSLAFRLDDGVLFGGDTVLGRGTSFVEHPDGALGPYLASLRRLRELAAAGKLRLLLPGHGPPVLDPLKVIDHYLAHRAERLAQVRAAVAAGARTPGDVVARVYADVDHALWPAAERSVRAQMDYLASEVHTTS